uniref:Uncharacterized protein n=1 Tax=Lactuca sativa TaxID=4236 RepID=A0A9R1XFC6_LACSA|nr:hypothetical protein LSAT_V11C400205670 [Lactuca sativa]
MRCFHTKVDLKYCKTSNEGPRCSSFGYGAMEELGPFRVNSDGKNSIAMIMHGTIILTATNVLFLESPAGVGFSYSNTSYVTGDMQTAKDSRKLRRSLRTSTCFLHSLGKQENKLNSH